MELSMTNGFSELSHDEMEMVDGGFSVGKVFCGCLLVVAGGITAIVGVGTAIGTEGALLVPGIELAGAGTTAILAGAALIKSGSK